MVVVTTGECTNELKQADELNAQHNRTIKRTVLRYLHTLDLKLAFSREGRHGPDQIEDDL
jgi:hypothetical protein